MKLWIDLAKAAQMGLFGAAAPAGKPPGTGWEAIPKGKHGGYRRHSGTGAGYEYWYPGGQVQARPRPGDEHAAPKPTPEPEGTVESKPPEPPKQIALGDVQAEPPEPKKPRGKKYVDVGEEVKGARKHLYLGTKAAADLEASDPAAARAAVTRDKTLGKWSSAVAEQYQAGGMESYAAFSVGELWKSVAGKPKDDPSSRRNYVQAVEMLREGFARVKTMDDYKSLVNEWRDATQETKLEVSGGDLHYDAVQAYYHRMHGSTASENREALANLEARLGFKIGSVTFAGSGVSGIHYVVHPAGVPNGKQLAIALGRSFCEMLGYKVSEDRHWGKTRFYDLGSPFDPSHTFGRLLGYGAQRHLKALKEWSAALLEVRKQHANLEGSDTSWPWLLALKEREGVKKAKPGDAAKPGSAGIETKEGREKVWQRKLGIVERVGMPEVKAIANADALADIGLRAVQFGNTASDDERFWHAQSTYAALHDLAKIIDVDPRLVTCNGRLAIGIGARGKGGKRAAAAHYEGWIPNALPGDQRAIINLTKMRGQGTLCHEWGHFLDNMIEVTNSGGHASGYASDVKAGNDNGELRKAMSGVIRAIKASPETAEDKAAREKEIEQLKLKREQINDDLELDRRSLGPSHKWTSEQIAAYNKGVNEHNTVRAQINRLRSLAETSRFYSAASMKDGDKKGNDRYWSTERELLARCFESYVEDKLTERGAKSTYLVSGTKPEEVADFEYVYIKDPKHRALVNSAMDLLMGAIKSTETLKKASCLMRIG